MGRSYQVFMLLMVMFSKLNAYDLTICAIFKEDARYLPEWIDFHIKQGVEHFWLYDNNSSEDCEKLLRKYIKKKIVTIMNWPKDYSPGDLIAWNKIQCEAYNHCLSKIKDSSKWCAFIDTDEFLFCPDGTKLPAKLKAYKKYQAIGVNWVCYGTSNKELNPCEPILKNLLLRSEINAEFNKHVKCIVKTRETSHCENPHWFFVNNPSLYVTENQEPMNGPFSPYVSVNVFRINHYLYRDLNFLKNFKIPRYKKWGYSEESIEGIFNFDKFHLNKVYDNILAR